MLQVAFATTDRARVNQHFGTAMCFAIYRLDDERAKLITVAEFPDATMDGNEGKLGAKIAALNGCAAVYCLAVGGSAVRQLLAQNIQPIRLDEVQAIERLLLQLRTAVREGGVPWIDKAIRRAADDERFDRMASEGWAE